MNTTKYDNPFLLSLPNIPCSMNQESTTVLYNEDQIVLCAHKEEGWYKQLQRQRVLQGFGGTMCDCFRIAEDWLSARRGGIRRIFTYPFFGSGIGPDMAICFKCAKRLITAEPWRMFASHTHAVVEALNTVKTKAFPWLTGYSIKNISTSLPTNSTDAERWQVKANIHFKNSTWSTGYIKILERAERFVFSISIKQLSLTVYVGNLCVDSLNWLFLFTQRFLLAGLIHAYSGDLEEKQNKKYYDLGTATEMLNSIVKKISNCNDAEQLSAESAQVLLKKFNEITNSLMSWLRLQAKRSSKVDDYTLAS